MKQKIFLILVAIITARLSSEAFDYNIDFNYSDVTVSNTESKEKVASSEKALAVEGRTWWYKGFRHEIGDEQEWGLKIGNEVIIDNEKWNKVILCMYTNPHQPDVSVPVVKDSLNLCYIKDDGCTISFKHGEAQWIIPAMKFHYTLISDANDTIFTTYKFGQIGDTSMYGGRYINHPYKINAIENISNSGLTYKVYTAQFNDDSGKGYLTGFENKTYSFIKGIGHLSGLFMCPLSLGYGSTTRWEIPELTYVTEGDDNHVIYEAAGGKKLWEQAGVEPVAVDEVYTSPQWFNLQGLTIDAPSTPGIYIRRTGSRTEKIVIR